MSIINFKILLSLSRMKEPDTITSLSEKLNFTVPFISKEIGKMHDAEIIIKERVGKKVYVCANQDSQVIKAINALNSSQIKDEHLEKIFSSNTSIKVLSSLLEGQKGIKELAEETGKTQRTIYRIIRDIKEIQEYLIDESTHERKYILNRKNKNIKQIIKIIEQLNIESLAIESKIKFPLKKRQQALLHLLEFQEDENERTAPRSMAQDGIADGIGIQKKHVPRILNQLIELNRITERKVHVPGKKQRVKAYFLTGNGWTHANDMKKQLLTYRVEISNEAGNNQTVQLSQASEVLGLHLSFMELIKLVSGNRIDCQNAVEIDALKKYAKVVFTEEPFIQPYFFGRDRELEELRELVSSRELGTVYITGPSGIGKTSLMKKLGSELKIRWNIFSFRFDERTSLRGFLKGLSNFLSRIGCHGLKSHMELNISLDVEEVILIIQNDAQNAETLLLLDNIHKMNRDITRFISRLIENELPGLGLLFFGIDCSNIPYYVRKSSLEIKLEGLGREESISLLRHRRNVPESSFDMIYKMTSGNPLFLELINVEKIPQEGDIHQYMKEGLIISLTQPQINLLKLISTLRNPVTFMDILHIVTIGQANIGYDEDISDIVEVLVEKSLIKVKDQDTYETHDIVKNIFYSICTSEEKIKNHGLLASYYSVNQIDAPVQIEMLYHHLKANKMDDFLELAIAQGSELISKGYVRELSGLLNELDMNSIHPEERINIHLFNGEIDFILGSWESSIEAYKGALDLIRRESGNPTRESECLRNIGKVFYLQEENEKALEYLNESLELSKKGNDVVGQAFCYLHLGTAHWLRAEVDSSSEMAKKGLKLIENQKQPMLTARLYRLEGITLSKKGLYQESIELHKKAIVELEEIGDIQYLTNMYLNIGGTYTQMGNLENAEQYLDKALLMARQTSNLRYTAHIYADMAENHVLQRDLEKAMESCDQAERLFRAFGEKWILSYTQMIYGMIHREKKNWKTSEEFFLNAMKLASECHQAYYHTRSCFEFGIMHKMNGSKKKALKYLNEANAGWRDIDNQFQLERTLKVIDEIKANNQ